MPRNKKNIVLWTLIFASCVASGIDYQQAAAAEICPLREGQPLRNVDVFDGTPDELATLVPDKEQELSGYWLLAYVYNAGRFVTIRCKYADGQASDVKITNKIAKCDYKIDTKKTLTIFCK
jgi:hypothetical protein